MQTGRHGKNRSPSGCSKTMRGFIQAWQERFETDLGLAPASKLRREIALKALVKTWPALPSLDVGRISESDCRKWAMKAFREGTGFIAPGAKTTRRGMSPSAFNKC